MIDLHVHSTYSDGTLSPEELIALAEQIGLEAVALCDHNTVAGLPDFLAAAAEKKLQAVPGVEFSTDYQGTELHILGLFIQPQDYEEITAMTDEMFRRKEQSNRDLVAGLARAGYVLDYDEKSKRIYGQGDDINREYSWNKTNNGFYDAEIETPFD